MKPLGTGDPLRLGPYRVLGVLGEGGMGKVYVGQDGAGSLAAVKVLRSELTHDTNLAQRFVREAQAAQAVRSNGIANVLGAWTEGGRPWIATEFLAGLTLDQAVDSYGPLDEPALRSLATALARTLADIHAAGFIHRDLKPPNIVLTSAGPRVIDFGIARPEHGLTLTTTGQVPVTPGYGAPEQVLGRRVTPSADVFSLGAVLAYAATGRRAYEGSHVAAVQYAVVHGDPQLDGIPPHLQALILPCLAKDPAMRPAPPQIVQAMGAPKGADRVWRRGPVADAIREREAAARRLPIPVTTETAPSVSRRRLLTGLATGGVALAGGGGTAAWWFGSRGGSRSTKSDPFDIPQAVPVPAQKLDPLGIKDPINNDAQPTDLWEVHGEADAYSQTLLPIGDVIVFGVATGGIAGFDITNGKRRWSAPHLSTRSGYLPLSGRLVIGADDQGVLRTFVPSTGEPKWTCPAAEALALLAADDDAVYFVTKDHRLRSVNRSDARIRWTAAVPTRFRGNLLAPAVAAQGRLVISAADGTVLVVHTSDGSTAWTRLDQDEDLTVSPVVHDDTVYINGKSMDARRLSDGTRIWNTKLDDWSTDGYKWGPAAVYADAVYTNAGDSTRCLGKDSGKVRWEASQNANYGSPVVRQGHGVWTFGNTSNGYGPQLLINAVRASDGKDSRSYTVPDPDYARLAAAGNRVFVMHDSSVIALSTF
ncbi:Serine/threonine-protein kinase PknD [Streptomyces sp. RB17]|uniref:serine/threonine-protein kinase n=1 Tax=Streptomyces sp. RB17 TaxID=2585197 RepID=UPI001296A8C3|nr:serine/threonine-protein kinase [Streptomyces sp. RB17]MQY39228.1 Serine/threonine-protein kinase PknD [Streptomyces sp. RB17]